MADDVEHLRERIASAESLYSIVETMRTLANVNIRRANQAAAAAGEYLRSVHIALHVALHRGAGARPRPKAQPNARAEAARTAGAKANPRADQKANLAAKDKPGEPPGAALPILLVLSSNQGLCGSFNERVAKRAASVAAEAARGCGASLDAVPVVCVGYRGAGRLMAMGARVEAVLDAPSSVEAVGPLVREVYRVVSDRLRPGRRFIAVYNRPAGGAAFVESDVQLLPFDPARWRRLPEGEPPFGTIPTLGGGPVERVLEELLRELLFIDLYRALVESFAAENAARLYSMQGAAENIEELIGELTAAYRQARQDAITNELMDIVGGMFAMEGMLTY